MAATNRCLNVMGRKVVGKSPCLSVIPESNEGSVTADGIMVFLFSVQLQSSKPEVAQAKQAAPTIGEEDSLSP